MPITMDAPHPQYCLKGRRLLVQEWDGTIEIVQVEHVTPDSITFRYIRDGLTHCVPLHHFMYEMRAMNIAQA